MILWEPMQITGAPHRRALGGGCRSSRPLLWQLPLPDAGTSTTAVAFRDPQGPIYMLALEGSQHHYVVT